jgi:hypothetical protein
MKKAPNNLPAAGALGEQLSLIDPPEFSASFPKPATLPDRLLDRLLAGDSLTHPEWQAKTSSWRLAASVQVLRDCGWPVDTLPIAAPTPDNPDRTIARYRLPPEVITKGRELRRGVR